MMPFYSLKSKLTKEHNPNNFGHKDETRLLLLNAVS